MFKYQFLILSCQLLVDNWKVLAMTTRRRRDNDDWRDEFDDLFEEFGFDFDRWNERMMRTWDHLLRDPNARTYGPYIYGFTYKMGPDGKPRFEEFGNVPHMANPGISQSMGKDVREPITDINVDDRNVYVTYELPGISKEDIELSVSENNITLRVDRGPRKYLKSLDFDYDLKPGKAVAKFTNGILDLTVEKETKTGSSGTRISIE